jgi:hypothetical protein
VRVTYTLFPPYTKMFPEEIVENEQQ